MKKKTITSFIHSKNRVASDKVYDFVVDYPDGIISCRDNEYIELNVVSFDMLNNMYNINSTNNSLKVNGTLTYIPYGNYSVKTFRTMLLTLLPIGTTILYNEAQNTYSFTGTGTIQPITMGALIGLTNDIQVPIDNLTTGLINLSSFSKIILRTQGITYYQSNLENLQVTTSNLQLFSDIIFWKNKQDIEPFKIIAYNNEDGGNNFCLEVQDKMIFRLQFQLKNEKNEFIEDAPDWMAVIQYNIYERQDDVMKLTLISLLKLLNDFYISFLTLAQKMKLL
jgi:hypothetical protein